MYQKSIQNCIIIWFSLRWYIWILFLQLVTRCRKTHPVWRTTYLEYSHKEVNLSWYQIIRNTFFLTSQLDEKYIHPYSHFSRLLFDVLAIVASPLGSLHKTALDTMKPKLKSNLPPLEHHENVAVWMHLIRPGIFHSPNPDAMCAESHIVLLAKLAANQPYPAWSLIVQLLLVTFNAICLSN